MSKTRSAYADFSELARQRRQNDIPTFLEMMLLVGRDPHHILKNYGWAMSWKIVLFCKVCGRIHARTHMHKLTEVP